jgi:hypothetical protein
MLLLYIWLDEYWMAAHNVADYRSAAQLIPRNIHLTAFDCHIPHHCPRFGGGAV